MDRTGREELLKVEFYVRPDQLDDVRRALPWVSIGTTSAASVAEHEAHVQALEAERETLREALDRQVGRHVDEAGAFADVVRAARALGVST